MAIRCSSYPLNINKLPPNMNMAITSNKVVMLSNAHISSSITAKPLFQFTSSFKNKVFEDEAKGIVCYKDDNGEIVCEGYDEGPRHQKQDNLTLIDCANYRDAKIVDLLERSFRQILIKRVDEDASGSSFC